MFSPGVEPSLKLAQSEDGVTVVVPQLPSGSTEQEIFAAQKQLADEFVAQHRIAEFTAWYYTPMALNFTRQLNPAVVVYDCMDELSAFRGAPPGLRAAEAELFSRADLVFTGGQSLYDSKRNSHPSVHLFPSSIDVRHFSQARGSVSEPGDQVHIAHPRFGFCGVIDERMDIALLEAVADLRPEWQFVMIGPVVKIAPEDLPHRPNIHYLGGRKYSELPQYMSGWDIGMLPFALNESTRFISPTKTPEYLAAGLKVVSTPIADVVRPYGELGLVKIAKDAEEFVKAGEDLLKAHGADEERKRLERVDAFLARSSWDATWNRMQRLIADVAENREAMTGNVALTAEPTAGSSNSAD